MTDPARSRADAQKMFDQHAKSRPNSSYRGSCVDDTCGGGINWLKVAVFLIIAIVLWQVIKLLQR